MEKWCFMSKEEFEHGCGLNNSIDNIGSIQNTGGSESGFLNDNDTDKNIPNHNGGNNDSSSYSNIDRLFGVRYTLKLIDYSINVSIKNKILEVDNEHSFLSELEIYTYKNYSYRNNGSKGDASYYDRYMYNTKKDWNKHITSFIENYLHSQTLIHNYILSDSGNYSAICGESVSSSESKSFSIRTSTNGNDLTIRESSNDLDVTQKYRHLWVQCENCYELNYKKLFKSKMNICEQCGYHLKMSSSGRIELLIDPGTWYPMDEDMISLDPIEFHSEEKPYKERIDFYQKKTGLPEAVQTGVGQLNGIPIAVGVMDFQFMGGSMGSVVGEKITRLIEYATHQLLPLIIVCASGGARMQEGSLSLMQMAKISSALYDYQLNKKLFYISILTSPTTGGVTASFGMLGDIIIAEPNAYIAFAGKRVIEQTLNTTVPEGSQVSEYLFHKGLFDPIVPRNLLKDILSEFFQLHTFFPLNQN
uniref:Acetyl-coenzyme A carboxylase carboxyl transferase subunit beta, chloroplastic n=1 Tax=Cecarria obtusifolia TaxID=364664 RepID=A0A8K1HMB1_9MAGN|nr:Acetyl-CoA carboxylase carboxyltransferase beta subunit [Cecarria obtusifolia]UBN07815.1 Acetyl-CoA carboxylase carboxyltransferase beta subunit [Cecarria obtusifolia]